MKKNYNFIIVIVLIVLGVFIFNQYKKEAVYTPTGQAAPSIYNRWYYDTATNLPPDTCGSTPSVVFRSSFDITQTSLPTITTYIVLGSPLVSYRWSNAVSLGTGQTCENYGTVLFHLPGGLTVNTGSGKYYVCYQSVNGAAVREYILCDLGSACLSTSPIPTGVNEITSSLPQKDSGKYVCKDNAIKIQYCGSFGYADVSSAEYGPVSCANGCSYNPSAYFNGMTKAIVKCNGDYKPGQSICSSDGKILYTTNSQGNLTIKNCDWACQNNQFCYQCEPNVGKGCNGNIPWSCPSGEKVNGATCTGLTSCVGGVCTSDQQDGWKRCSGKQIQVYRTSASNYINENLPLCRTECVSDNITHTASCKNECNSGDIFCDSSIAVLKKCDVNANTGNQKVLYGANILASTCYSGACLNANSCMAPYNLNEQYCVGKNRTIVMDDPNNLLNGKVKLDLIDSCTTACLNISTISTSCYVAPTECTGNENYCSLGDVYKCDNGQKGNIVYDCYGDNNCLDSPARCKDLCTTEDEKICQGSPGNVWKCIKNATTQQKYYVFDTDCGSFGCSNGKCNGLSYCVGHASDYVCEGDSPVRCKCSSDETSCTETTTCPNGCNKETNACINLAEQCSGEYGCYNGKMYICSAEGQFTATEKYNCQGLGCYADSSIAYPANSHCNPNCNTDVCGTGVNQNKLYKCKNYEISTGYIHWYLSTESTDCGKYKCQNNGQYCDDLAITLLTTAFAPGTVGLKFVAKGSASGFLADLPSNSVSITTSGPGISTQTVTADSGVDGYMYRNMGNLPQGKYHVSVSVPAYYFTQEYDFIVTDQYIISIPAGKETVFQIPNQPTYVNLLLTPSNAPSSVSLITTQVPSTLAIKGITPDPAGQGKYLMEISGNTGSYDLKLKTSAGDNEYSLHVDYKKPQLFVDSNLGTSSKVGTTSYHVDVTGHVSSDGKIDYMKAGSNPTVIVNGESVKTTDVGGGRYNFDYTFASEGSYVFDITALKSGYDDGKKSFTVIATKGGLGGGSVIGNKTISCMFYESYNGSSCNINWILVIVAIVLLYFGYRLYKSSKKRRR